MYLGYSPTSGKREKAGSDTVHSSPIEDILWRQLVSTMGSTQGFMIVAPDDAVSAIQRWDKRFGVVATRQLRWLRYVIDIGILVRLDDEIIPIAIECDGHDYHERTKEQAARDKSRDRALVADGVRVLRFTGSEIWHDAWECAEEICGVIIGEMERQKARVGGGHEA